MVREGDRTLSSIALLQERFRQLQKMKELRQEKELLRMLSESERYSPPTINNHQLHSKQFSGSSEPTFVPDPKPHCQLSLSLWPDSHIKHADTQETVGNQSNLAKSAWFTDHAPLVCSTSSIGKNIENYPASDIDTSLRL